MNREQFKKWMSQNNLKSPADIERHARENGYSTGWNNTWSFAMQYLADNFPPGTVHSAAAVFGLRWGIEKGSDWDTGSIPVDAA